MTSSRRAPLHSVVTLLCVVSGSLDAISFLALGDVFTSVMTGNIVMLGVAAGTLDPQLALRCGVAVLSYVAGVGLGSWLADRWAASAEDHRSWPAPVMKVLGLQLFVVATLALGWTWLDGEIGPRLAFAILAVAAASMGLQGAAVRRVGVSVSTTYMTGALTQLLECLVTGRRLEDTETSAVAGLTALAVGALLGGVVLAVARPAALLVPAVALAGALAIMVAQSGWPRRQG